jgi:hypothetical protein
MRRRRSMKRSYGRKKGGYRKVSRTYYVSRGGIRL